VYFSTSLPLENGRGEKVNAKGKWEKTRNRRSSANYKSRKKTSSCWRKEPEPFADFIERERSIGKTYQTHGKKKEGERSCGKGEGSKADIGARDWHRRGKMRGGAL